MLLRRQRTDAQLYRDLLIGSSVRDEVEDRELAEGEPVLVPPFLSLLCRTWQHLVVGQLLRQLLDDPLLERFVPQRRLNDLGTELRVILQHVG